MAAACEFGDRRPSSQLRSDGKVGMKIIVLGRLIPGSDNERFSELSADCVFSLQSRVLAIRNIRLEKQSSIYSRQMSKLNCLCFRSASRRPRSISSTKFWPIRYRSRRAKARSSRLRARRRASERIACLSCYGQKKDFHPVAPIRRPDYRYGSR
jgi:hypothetical protein